MRIDEGKIKKVRSKMRAWHGPTYNNRARLSLAPCPHPTYMIRSHRTTAMLIDFC